MPLPGVTTSEFNVDSPDRIWSKILGTITVKQGFPSIRKEAFVVTKAGVPTNNNVNNDPGKAGVMCYDSTNNDVYVCTTYGSENTHLWTKVWD